MAYNDGYSNAPAGAPQLANLLNGYAVRPPWHVAGVDYAVGVPSGPVLKDWETLSQPGVSVNVSGHTVYITGNNVTLNGIDFSLHGGAQLVVYGSNDTVSNSNFLYGTALTGNSSLIGGTGSNLTVEDCVLNGNGPTLGSSAANQSSLIGGAFNGTTTLQHNLFENFNQHVLEMDTGSGTQSVIYQYNVVYNGGSGAPSAHLNYLQFGNGTFQATVEYNTTYQPTVPVSGGEGFQFYNNGTGSVTGTFAYNTQIYSPNGDGVDHLPGGGANTGTTRVSVYDNYIDKVAGTGHTFFYPDPNAGTLDHYSGDINMLTGALIDAPDPSGSVTSPPITAPSGPKLNSIFSPASGDLNAGKTVTLTLNLSEAVMVASGTPTLTLNDGGTATYTGGSGTNALTFSYTVAAGQNTSALAATAVNLNSATIKDSAGNAANLSFSGLTQSGPQIDTTAPTGLSPSPTPTGSSGSPPAPTIASLSPNQGTATASGGYTDAHKLTLSGTAVANSEVEVFDRSTRLGTATVGSRGAWTYAPSTLSDGTHDFTAKDVNSAGNVSAASPMFDVTVVSPASLSKTGNTFDITAAASDPALKYKGANVTVGEFGGWTPIGAVKTASGYDVAWKNTRTNQYTVWTTDNNGNYTGNLIGTVSANSTQWTSIAPIFPQTVNSGGTDPTTKLIQKDGSTSLTEIANHYNLDGSGSDPTLKYKGRSVTAGEFGKWTPIGAVKTATGYDVAWKNTGSGQYTVWSTDSNGNYKGFSTGSAVSGTSSALESLEPVFRQDLNRDGVIGLTTRKVVHTAVVNHTTQKVIQKDGSTSLTEVGNRYYDLDGSNGSGPTVKYKGRSVTAGEFGAWTPIGAIQTASGYDVAWKNTGTGQYTVWGTDSNGNYKGFLTGGAVSGTSSALESLEPIFHQDLNRDGVIGLTTRKVVHTAVVNHTTQKVIQKDGSTSLTEVGNRYYDLDGSNGSGPTVKYKGRSVTAGEFGAWTPIGAIQTASGYDVAWKNTGTGQYTVWGTDSNGNYKGFLTGGAVSGTSSALESLEPIFHQDLNRDGVIGLDAAPGKTLQISQALGGTSGSAMIGTGATLELTAADSASVTFAGPTGTLRLDHSSTFSGKISKFGGNGSLSGSDHIDLRDVKYSSVHDSYSNGVLTVTDGSGDTAKLSFNGSYSLGNFKFANDGSGGTIVYDPPTASSEQAADVGSPASISRSTTTATADLPRIAFDVESMLGNLPDRNQAGGKSPPDGGDEAKIALLGNYMASMFATNGSHTGITRVAEVPQPNDHSVLSSPSHA